ncbi:MAG: hypothetical protein ABSG10_07235 [Terracidiphilus sp.]|jgi:hypothetical protein
MDIIKMVVQLVTGLAWPVVVLLVAFMFKRELRLLLSRISHFKYRDLEFKLALAEAEKKADVIEQTARFSYRSSSDIDSKLEQLRRIADVSPRAAIMEAWILVEDAAAQSGFIQGADTPRINAPSFVLWLVRDGKLPAGSDELVTRLRNLRDQAAAHKMAQTPPFELTREDADRYLQLAAKASSMILGPEK